MSNLEKFDSIKSYQALINDLDNKVKNIVNNYSQSINCRDKCSDCCCNIFNISIIEGYYLQQGYDLLRENDKDKIQENIHNILADINSGKSFSKEQIICPLLSDGSCLLYEYRPLICRAFGVPIKDETTGQITTCNKNFLDLRIGEVTLDTVSLRPLSIQMVVLSQFLMKELGKKVDDKIIPPLYSILDIVVAKLRTSELSGQSKSL